MHQPPHMAELWGWIVERGCMRQITSMRVLGGSPRTLVGVRVGGRVGGSVGNAVGERVGLTVGLVVGTKVGRCVRCGMHRTRGRAGVVRGSKREKHPQLTPGRVQSCLEVALTGAEGWVRPAPLLPTRLTGVLCVACLPASVPR